MTKGSPRESQATVKVLCRFDLQRDASCSPFQAGNDLALYRLARGRTYLYCTACEGKATRPSRARGS